MGGATSTNLGLTRFWSWLDGMIVLAPVHRNTIGIIASLLPVAIFHSGAKHFLRERVWSRPLVLAKR